MSRLQCGPLTIHKLHIFKLGGVGYSFSGGDTHIGRFQIWDYDQKADFYSLHPRELLFVAVFILYTDDDTVDDLVAFVSEMFWPAPASAYSSAVPKSWMDSSSSGDESLELTSLVAVCCR